LATVTTCHVLGGTEAFFADVQDCYQRWDPATPPGLRLPPADVVVAVVDEIDDSKCSGQPFAAAISKTSVTRQA